MESIFIPPIANAPFSLTLLTEWSRPLAIGGSYTLTNQRRIARDGKGRIYEERWLLLPKGSKVPSFMDVRQFADPNRHTLYNCFTDGKLCQLLPYSGSTQAVYKPATSPTGPLPDGTGFHQHEDLGVADTNGVDTTGFRAARREFSRLLREDLIGRFRPEVAALRDPIRHSWTRRTE
jgi:hypothetical protein